MTHLLLPSPSRRAPPTASRATSFRGRGSTAPSRRRDPRRPQPRRPVLLRSARPPVRARPRGCGPEGRRRRPRRGSDRRRPRSSRPPTGRGSPRPDRGERRQRHRHRRGERTGRRQWPHEPPGRRWRCRRLAARRAPNGRPRTRKRGRACSGSRPASPGDERCPEPPRTRPTSVRRAHWSPWAITKALVRRAASGVMSRVSSGSSVAADIVRAGEVGSRRRRD